MKICYISYVQYGGGYWVHTSQFIAALKNIHHDLVVHTPLVHLDESAEDEKEPHFWETSRLINKVRELRTIAAMFARRAVSEFRLLKAVKPDVVILRQGRYLSAIPLCRLLNIPIIIEVNGPALEDQFAPQDEQLRGKVFWQWLERKMMALPDHIMVVSETLKQYYVRSGVPHEKMTSVPNGVDIRTFNPDITGERIREKLGMKGKTVIGFSGSFAPWHGLDFLADAIKLLTAEPNKHQEVVLLLIGEPWDILTMPDLPGEITIITGHIPHDEVPEYLAAIDIFVAPYPKISPFYFSPLKIFEAMSMGKPVIASAQGQICQLITDGTSGLLYQPGDQVGFIRSIERLIHDTQLRHELGRHARKAIENNFTWKDNACRMLNICRQVVERKKSQ